MSQKKLSTKLARQHYIQHYMLRMETEKYAETFSTIL